MEKEELFKKAENLLEQCRACVVSSVTEDGYPRICVMVQLLNESIKTIYFSTSTASTKVRHYRVNPKAGVTFFNGGDSVTLVGEMTIVDDPDVKDALWRDWLTDHFPKGKKDPDYCIVKFKAKEATIYIGGHTETCAV